MGKYKRKYKPGRKIKSLNSLFKYFEKNDFVYCNGKPFHRGWVFSWQLRMVKSYIDRGSLKKALKND